MSLSHASAGENTLVQKGLRKVSEANTATIFGGEKTQVARIEASDVSEAPSVSPSLAPSVGPSAKGDANNDLESAAPSPSITTGAGDGTDATEAPSISPTLSMAPSTTMSAAPSTTMSAAPSTSPSVAKSAKPTSQPSKETVPNSNNGNGSPKDDEEGNSPQYFRTIAYLVSSAAVAFALFKFVQHKRRERLMKERELVIADSNYSYNTNGHLQEFFNDDEENEII